MSKAFENEFVCSELNCSDMNVKNVAVCLGAKLFFFTFSQCVPRLTTFMIQNRGFIPVLVIYCN